MRKIKFKVWDKYKSRWFDQSELIFSDGKWFENARAIQDYVALSDSDIEVVQCTNLKDRNGIEIYEGDIITSEHYPFQNDGEYNYHALVEWADEQAAYYLTMYLANKNKRGISHLISESMEQYESEDFEIIGNIYENSKLLEQE